jgi:hypothetical protein
MNSGPLDDLAIVDLAADASPGIPLFADTTLVIAVALEHRSHISLT